MFVFGIITFINCSNLSWIFLKAIQQWMFEIFNYNASFCNWFWFCNWNLWSGPLRTLRWLNFKFRTSGKNIFRLIFYLFTNFIIKYLFLCNQLICKFTNLYFSFMLILTLFIGIKFLIKFWIYIQILISIFT